MSPLKIALIASSYLPHVGGVEEHVRNVARVLHDRGHVVTVWTVARSGVSAVGQIDGITVRELPCPLPSRSWRSIGAFLRAVPRAIVEWSRAYRADRPDILHVQCFGPNGTYARLLRRVVRKPLVVSAHGETLGDADGVFESSAFLRRSLTFGLRDADAVTGCSQVVLDDLKARFGLGEDAGVVVFNGIDLDEVPEHGLPALPESYLLAVGRLVGNKGFDLLIDAFARASLPPGVKLVIGGDGPMGRSLGEQAERLGVGDRVVLPGRLDRGQVVSTMNAALALVVPSRFEAFGLTVLEGWRAGVPVIATNRGGVSEFVQDGVDGSLVDPEDITAFAAAIERVVVDRRFGARLGAAGRESVQAFTSGRVADRYEQIYEPIADVRTVGARPQGDRRSR